MTPVVPSRGFDAEAGPVDRAEFRAVERPEFIEVTHFCCEDELLTVGRVYRVKEWRDEMFCGKREAYPLIEGNDGETEYVLRTVSWKPSRAPAAPKE